MSTRRTALLITLIVCTLENIQAQKIAIVHYQGGGDWYSNPTSVPNLIRFCNKEIRTTLVAKPHTVRLDQPDLFDYPMLHMTGHGHVFFDTEDAKNLELYLRSGGFLHIDDNYGMEPFIRKELTKVFPDQKLEELPTSHPIFKKPFEFDQGLPKIHEHDGKPPKALGIHIDGRLVLLFTYESDLGDGWENPEIHNDPEDVRQKALQMGANIVHYAFNH